MNILKTVNDYLTKIYLDFPSISWVPRMTERHLLNDSFHGITPKTPQPPDIQPKPTPQFWRPAETPGPMSALEKNIKIIDSSEKISSDEENVDGEQEINALSENDHTEMLYRSFCHEMKRFQPVEQVYPMRLFQPQHFHKHARSVVRRTVITETICQTGKF